jgi:hypothetical protein
MLDSPAYRDLPPSTKVILTAIHRIHNGTNNGRIAFSSHSGIRWGIKSPTTTHKALVGLYYHGFIIPVKKGHYTERQATEWALTFERVDGKAPSHKWSQYDAKQKKVPNIDSYNTII